jgi:hypothetical protein
VRILTANKNVTLLSEKATPNVTSSLSIHPQYEYQNQLLLIIDWRMDVPLGILNVMGSKLNKKNTVIVDPEIKQQLILRIRLSLPVDKAHMLNSSTIIRQLTTVNVYNLTAN